MKFVKEINGKLASYSIPDGFHEATDAELETLSTQKAALVEKDGAERKIIELKKKLTATDYVDNKIIEAYILSGVAEAENVKALYAEQLKNRETWRAEINELQEKYGI
jgi:hypothetical protein